MGRVVSIGNQSFSEMREYNDFYIDKTHFIKEWWENRDKVTLITRPRRFGKTLNMSMIECFFSVKFAERADLFKGLSVWDDPVFRKLQGTIPVINFTFSSVKDNTYDGMIWTVCDKFRVLFNEYAYVLKCDKLADNDRAFYSEVTDTKSVEAAKRAMSELCRYLYLYHGKYPIVLLDEYDSPLQEAWVNGFWDEAVSFFREMFNATFKENPYLERAVITGVTRVSKESLFSDLNNLKVATIMTDLYTDCFGFTEEEVFAAMDEMGLTDKESVKNWYDGFTVGEKSGIYNPWSITNYLDNKGKLKPYWANTSSNALAGKVVREGNKLIKQQFETLLNGGSIETEIDEEISFRALIGDGSAIWSLLFTSGYLTSDNNDHHKCTLRFTNREIYKAFDKLILNWFDPDHTNYNLFINAFLSGDLRSMNAYMNDVAMDTFSYFDTGNRPSEKLQPERFYHGFVLGLIAELRGRYIITSNRESGYGRYDIMLEPTDKINDPAYIIEFKVIDKEENEQTLKDTVAAALKQIEEKQYAAALTSKGIPDDRIRRYAFAFEGKEVLIGTRSIGSISSS